MNPCQIHPRWRLFESVPNRVQLDSQLRKDPGGQATRLLKNPQQQMVRVDVYRASPTPGFFIGVRENALALARQRQIDRCGYLVAGTNTLLNNPAQLCQVSRAVSLNEVPVFARQAEQEVLRFDCHASQLA